MGQHAKYKVLFYLQNISQKFKKKWSLIIDPVIPENLYL